MNWLIGHLVGDFLLQNDFQALGKKRSSWVCLLHCLLYAGSIWLFTAWPVWVIGLIAVAHFIQDRGPLVRKFMLAIGQEQFATGPLSPWSLIVIDQVLHLVLLYVPAQVLAGELVLPGLGF